MRIFLSTLLCAAALGLAACSSANDSTNARTEQVRVVQAGEKAVAGHLSYSVLDFQVMPQLGEDPNPRIPHDRFLLVQLAVTNTSNVDNPIPTIELVADSGKTFEELTDGNGVTNWLGIVRHVGAGQTERGVVAFDAPAAHYKVRFKDETATNEILMDLPLNFEHEKVNDAFVPSTDLPQGAPPAGTPQAK
jgi:hypothetical protein